MSEECQAYFTYQIVSPARFTHWNWLNCTLKYVWFVYFQWISTSRFSDTCTPLTYTIWVWRRGTWEKSYWINLSLQPYGRNPMKDIATYQRLHEIFLNLGGRNSCLVRTFVWWAKYRDEEWICSISLPGMWSERSRGFLRLFEAILLGLPGAQSFFSLLCCNSAY